MANDGKGGTDTATVTITVAPVNDAPEAVDDAYSANEDDVLTILAAQGVLANDSDVDGDPLTAVLVSGTSSGTLAFNSDGSFTYTPNADFNGTDSFTYNASDSKGGTDTATVTITVAPVGVDLRMEPASTTVTPGAIFTLDIMVEASGDQPVDAAQAYLNFDSDLLQVVDAIGNTTSSTTPGPIFGSGWNDLLENSVDNNLGQINFAGGKGTGGTAAQTAFVLATVRFKVTGSGTTTQLVFNSSSPRQTKAVFGGSNVIDNLFGSMVTITNFPVAVDDAYSVNEDNILTVSVAQGVLANDSDADGDPLTAVLVSGTSSGTLALNSDGSFTYTPDANFSGTDSFTFNVNDGTVDSAPAGVTITVTPVNDAPVAVDDAATTLEDTAVDIPVLANDTDVEGDTLTVASVTQGAQGAVAINPDDTVQYTPDADFHGTDSFTFKVNDGTVDSAPAAVTITITPVNDAPVLAPLDDLIMDVGTTTTLLLSASDLDGTTTTLSVVGLPSFGSFVDNGDGTGSITLAPKDGDGGVYPMTVTATDGGGLSHSRPLTLTVRVPVTFVVTLQGRQSTSGPSWITAFKVDLYAPGANPTDAPVLPTYDAMTDENGTFVLNIMPGTYDIRAKGEHTLRVLKRDVDLTGPVATVDLGEQIEGDYNGDNVVDSSDYAAVIFVFGELTANLPPNLKPIDLNQDGVVDVSDYSIIVMNFGKAGAAP